jgi:hypothetical protein
MNLPHALQSTISAQPRVDIDYPRQLCLFTPIPDIFTLHRIGHFHFALTDLNLGVCYD